MSDDPSSLHPSTPAGAPGPATGDRPTTPAQRALAEAEARRRARGEAAMPPETGGRSGPEPVRYGDWEKNGIICDF